MSSLTTGDTVRGRFTAALTRSTGHSRRGQEGGDAAEQPDRDGHQQRAKMGSRDRIFSYLTLLIEDPLHPAASDCEKTIQDSFFWFICFTSHLNEVCFTMSKQGHLAFKGKLT